MIGIVSCGGGATESRDCAVEWLTLAKVAMNTSNTNGRATSDLPPKKRRLRRAKVPTVSKKQSSTSEGREKRAEDNAWLEGMNLNVAEVDGMTDSVSFVRKAKRFVNQLTRVYPKGSPVFSTFAVVVRTFQSQGGDALDTVTQLRELLKDQPELLKEFVSLLPKCLHLPLNTHPSQQQQQPNP